jgi:hypothetical protein
MQSVPPIARSIPPQPIGQYRFGDFPGRPVLAYAIYTAAFLAGLVVLFGLTIANAALYPPGAPADDLARRINSQSALLLLAELVALYLLPLAIRFAVLRLQGRHPQLVLVPPFSPWNYLLSVLDPAGYLTAAQYRVSVVVPYCAGMLATLAVALLPFGDLSGIAAFLFAIQLYMVVRYINELLWVARQPTGAIFRESTQVFLYAFDPAAVFPA